MRLRQSVVAALCLGGIACGGKSATRAAGDPGADSGAIVVRGTELSGTLLNALRTHVPAMTVADQGPYGCPLVMFRGHRSGRNQGNPSVYVDGTLMADTCVLLQINSADVDRVEIYTGGITSKASVQRNPFGMILVYRKNH